MGPTHRTGRLSVCDVVLNSVVCVVPEVASFTVGLKLQENYCFSTIYSRQCPQNLTVCLAQKHQLQFAYSAVRRIQKFTILTLNKRFL